MYVLFLGFSLVVIGYLLVTTDKSVSPPGPSSKVVQFKRVKRRRL